jgi:hypothetical protein
LGDSFGLNAVWVGWGIAGKTEARLYLLAVRRVQLRIARELKKAVPE